MYAGHPPESRMRELVVLQSGKSSARLLPTAGGRVGHLVVHRPESLAYLCLEPVSHVADGFNLAARGVPDTGTRWLAPGDSPAGGMRFALQKAGAWT